MNGSPSYDPASEFAKELAKQLPVKAIYEEGASPAVKQTGQILEDLTKVVHLALAPIQYLGALQDRYRHFIDTSVRRVPEDRRISPAPQIVGPILEGIRYEPEGTPIDGMFSELLSKSMDRQHVNEAHPAFPTIIKQLSSDEAKILKSLLRANYDFVYCRDYDDKVRLFSGHKVEVDDLPRAALSFPDNVSFYFEHMNHLGLAGIFQIGNQEPLFAETERRQTGVRIRSKYRLTDFGRRFTTACIQSQSQ